MAEISSQTDVIIIGQGLAGTALAWSLRWSGRRVVVIDRNSDVTSSKIAAGLITPITGQKLVMTWRYASLWPAAVAFYHRVERETQSQFFREIGMVRIFENDNEVSKFASRQAAGEYTSLTQISDPSLDHNWFRNSHGGFSMSPGGHLNVPVYLDFSRRYFVEDASYLEANLDVSRDIELNDHGVRISSLGLFAKQIVFCQGNDAGDNPWFRDVVMKPAKGEILTLRIPDLNENRVVHQGVWLAPLGEEFFKVGSTYDWRNLNSVPSPEGRAEIIARLSRFLRLPYEVVSHEAAVRPIHRNQFPIVGLHPIHGQLGFFNGLGSKGALQAPFFAQQFCGLLNGTGVNEPDVDLNLKTQWKSIEGPLREGEKFNSTTSFHVERNRQSLTDQAQAAVREVVQRGEAVIDATAGNGHDTHFLADLVGPNGPVYAFDIQPMAIERTSKRLADAGFQNVILINDDHGRMSDQVPTKLVGQIAAVMFNLGYLPGGDKNLTTQVDTTLKAIRIAANFLRPGGLITVLAYTGHPGGKQESLEVRSRLASLPTSDFEMVVIEGRPGVSSSPILFLVKRYSGV